MPLFSCNISIFQYSGECAHLLPRGEDCKSTLRRVWIGSLWTQREAEMYLIKECCCFSEGGKQVFVLLFV